MSNSLFLSYRILWPDKWLLLTLASLATFGPHPSAAQEELHGVSLYNPYQDLQFCNLETSGYVCNADGDLSGEERIEISELVGGFNDDPNTVTDGKISNCKTCIVISSIKNKNKTISSNDLSKTIQKLLQNVANDPGKWEMRSCPQFSIIALHKKNIWVQPHFGAILCSPLKSLKQKYQAAVNRNVYKGLKSAIEGLKERFATIYPDDRYCHNDRCFQGFVPRKTSIDKTATELLPNPSEVLNMDKCSARGKSLICDPDRMLTEKENDDLLAKIKKESVRSDNKDCTYCIAVALLGPSHFEQSEYGVLARTILSKWEEKGMKVEDSGKEKKCTSIFLMIYSRFDQYLWLQGSGDSPHHNKLKQFLQIGKPHFESGDIKAGIAKIGKSYGDSHGFTEQCHQLSSLDFFRNEQQQNIPEREAGAGERFQIYRDTALASRVGLGLGLTLLVLILLIICCSIVCCREKTQHMLGSLSNFVSKHGGEVVNGLTPGAGRKNSKGYTQAQQDEMNNVTESQHSAAVPVNSANGASSRPNQNGTHRGWVEA